MSSSPSSSAERVDSSRNRALGLLSKMRANAIRCCSPTDVVWNPHLRLRGLLTVDVDELAVHLDGRVENSAQHAHRLEDFKRTWLDPNGFRVLRRLSKRVDDAAVDTASRRFDGGGQPDGARASDEHLRL
jgi:hypothetical protein